MTRRRVNTILIVSAVVLVFLYGLRGAPDNGAESPAMVVDDSYIPQEFPVVFDGPADLVGCVKWCWFASNSPSAVVLYQDESVSSNNAWYQATIVGLHGDSWHAVIEIGSQMSDGGQSAINFSSLHVPRSTITHRYGVKADYILTWGRIYDENVASIEIVDNTGLAIHTGVKDGMFAHFSDAAVICEIAALDNDGNVVQRLGPDNDPMLAHQIETLAPGGCPATAIAVRAQ